MGGKRRNSVIIEKRAQNEIKIKHYFSFHKNKIKSMHIFINLEVFFSILSFPSSQNAFIYFILKINLSNVASFFFCHLVQACEQTSFSP